MVRPVQKAFLLAIFAVAASGGIAVADYYAVGPPEAGWKPDNSEHTYCFGGNYTGNNMRDAAHAKMAGLDNQSTMARNYLGFCNQDTDARFGLENLPGSVIGQYTCPVRSGNYCLHAVLSYDDAAIVGSGQWLQVTCHEIGHSVGLFHGSNDCMVNQGNTYSNHHQQHINNDRF